jgi:hypothetical protein
VQNDSTQTVDARQNWWGQETGPTDTNPPNTLDDGIGPNPGGQGDAVTDYVLYEAWVVDTTPPSMTLTVLQANLWPPNHKLVLVAEVSGVSDICDPNPIVTINVSCNESTDPADWNVVENGKVWEIWVRSERLGSSPGREYYIDALATDASGNATEKTATITVAHDQGKR